MSLSSAPRRLLGLDPGLRRTGWGVIDVLASQPRYVAAGVIRTDDKAETARRLVMLMEGLDEVLDRWTPDAAAVEETFVNKNPASTLKLGLARGVVLLAPAKRGLPVAEYSPNLVKKTVVGAGHADKTQIQAMMRVLLPGSDEKQADAADALAIAVCHAHHFRQRHLLAAAGPVAAFSERREDGRSVIGRANRIGAPK